MIRILLVDDHAVVRSGYRRFLERHDDLRVVAEAADAEEGYGLFGQHTPDVSVVDISMAGVGGIELIRRMVAREPMARALAFSMHDDAQFVTRALQVGARGYVTKTSQPDTLVEAVRAVHAGGMYLSPDVAQRRSAAQSGTDPLALLSAKEFEVFRWFAEGHSSTDIAQALNLSRKTVANYQTQIKDKLGVSTTAALVHIALRHGVVKPPA